MLGQFIDSNNLSCSIPAKYVCYLARLSYKLTSLASPLAIIFCSLYLIAYHRYFNAFSASAYTNIVC